MDAWVSGLSDATARAHVLVRPDWAALGGDLAGTIEGIWYRGPHTDYRPPRRPGTW